MFFLYVYECATLACFLSVDIRREVRFPQTGSLGGYGTWCGANSLILFLCRSNISSIPKHVTYNPIYISHEWFLFNNHELFYSVGTSVVRIKIWVSCLYLTLRKWWNLIQPIFLLEQISWLMGCWITAFSCIINSFTITVPPHKSYI